MKSNLFQNPIFRWLPLLVSVVLLVFLLLIGILKETPAVYYCFAVATSAVALLGIWLLTKRATKPDHDVVFTIIGSGGLCTVLVFDVWLTLAYRGYLHLWGNDGAVIAVFFAVNAVGLLLLAFLSSFESFASVLSISDQRRSKSPADFFSSLQIVEQSFAIACSERNIAIRPSEPCKIRSLREQARTLSPSLGDGKSDSIEEEISIALADLRKFIEGERDAMRSDEAREQSDGWKAEVYRKCGYIEKLFRRREALVQV